MSKSYASKRAVRTLAGSILLPLAAAGCATKTQTGLLVGGAGGAAVGGAIGSASGNAGKGALIGGAVGLIGGGLIGHAADKSDEADRDREARQDADRRAALQRTENRPPANRPTEAYASAGDVGYGSYAPPRDTAAARGTRVSREQVVQWTQAGVRDDIIVDRIERSDTVFRMTTADERDLRQQGVSETVLMAMRDTARR